MIWYDIYLTAIGLTPGGSITRHIYNKQYTQCMQISCSVTRTMSRSRSPNGKRLFTAIATNDSPELNVQKVDCNIICKKRDLSSIIWCVHLLTYLLTNSLTPCNTVILEKLVKKFPTSYGTQDSLPHSQQLATCPYPEPTRSSPCDRTS